MAFTFGFYNSLDHDRTYTAEQMGAIFDGVIEDGVFSAIGEAMKVSAATGMSVDVGTGRAWFNHTWSLNDSKYRLTLDASDVTMQRIDAVVLEVDTTTAQRKNSLKIVKGTPVLNSPQRPALYNSNGIFQHALAYITVPANASAIVAGNITNVVGQGVAASGGAPFVTAPLNHVDISTLFTQWGGQFDAWFTGIKNQLSGSVVTNLQNQITANKTAITALQNADTTLQSQITANKNNITKLSTWRAAILDTTKAGSVITVTVDPSTITMLFAFANPGGSSKNVCYINAFDTNIGSTESRKCGCLSAVVVNGTSVYLMAHVGHGGASGYGFVMYATGKTTVKTVSCYYGAAGVYVIDKV